MWRSPDRTRGIIALPSGRSVLQPWLQRLLLRSALTEQEQCALLELPVTMAQVDVNRDFVKLGQVTDHACLVVEGVVGRFGQTRKGDRQITALYLPGDMADLHSVVLPRTDWALQALAATTLARIPHDALSKAAERSPAIARAFWRDGVVDASIIARWHVSLGRRDAKERMAHLLCELAARYALQAPDTPDEFDLLITQVQLADILGLTSVHVNRTIGTLRKDGLIMFSGRRVRIIDRKALEAIAGFERSYLHLEHHDAARHQG
jgi:CRP-like cAMP-binding protein